MISENVKQGIGMLDDLSIFNEKELFSFKKTIENEKEIFKSKKIMLEVVKVLDLDIFGQNNQKSEKDLYATADYFSEKVQVKTIKNSTLMELSISVHTQNADKILSELINQYDKYYIATKKDRLDNILTSLDEQIQRIGQEEDNIVKNADESLYSYLQKKKVEVILAQKFAISNCEIIDSPTCFPVKPRTKMIFLLAVIVGVCIPCLYYSLKEYFNVKKQ